MKNKFMIKASCIDDTIRVESHGTITNVLWGLRIIIKSMITEGNIPADLIMKTVKYTIEEAEHEPTEHDR